MSNFIDSVQTVMTDAYNYYLWTLTIADVKSKGWFLVESPIPTITCVFIYLLIVWVGPKLMKSRPPFKLTSILIAYNFAIAILNCYIVWGFFLGSYRLNYSYICEPKHLLSVHPEEIRIAAATWWFYFSKCLEFCDTIFFILRKKNNQISFLHVYHHSTMFPIWYIGIKWAPTGSTFLAPMINSCVHVLMYTYYGLTAMGPRVVKYLWWKKYLTIIQLIQFIASSTSSILAIHNGCDFPMWIHKTNILYMITLLILFGNFYLKSYKSNGKSNGDINETIIYPSENLSHITNKHDKYN